MHNNLYIHKRLSGTTQRSLQSRRTVLIQIKQEYDSLPVYVCLIWFSHHFFGIILYYSVVVFDCFHPCFFFFFFI